MTTRAAARAPAPDRRAPFLLVAAAALVSVAAVLPLAYLLVRALSADGQARSLVSVSTTLELLLDTAVLAAGVVLAAAAVGVPLAWLVVRTDLPARRFWGLAASLPTRDPELRRSAGAPRRARAAQGLLQQALEPVGVERIPEITGYWGAVIALTLSTYPYVFLLTAGALRSIDPSAEDPLAASVAVVLPSSPGSRCRCYARHSRRLHSS